MISTDLKFIDGFPRVILSVGYSDTLDPTGLAWAVREAYREHQIWRFVLQWYLRDGALKAEIPFDAREVIRNPVGVLLGFARSMVASARKLGKTKDLPTQFFTSEILDSRGEVASNVPSAGILAPGCVPFVDAAGAYVDANGVKLTATELAALGVRTGKSKRAHDLN